MSFFLEHALIFEFILLIGFFYAGSRFGGIGLGVVSGIGLLFEVLVLRMPPGKPRCARFRCCWIADGACGPQARAAPVTVIFRAPAMGRWRCSAPRGPGGRGGRRPPASA